MIGDPEPVMPPVGAALAEVFQPRLFRAWICALTPQDEVEIAHTSPFNAVAMNWLHVYLRYVKPTWIWTWGTSFTGADLYCYPTDHASCLRWPAPPWMDRFTGAGAAQYWALLTRDQAIDRLDQMLEERDG